MIYYDESVNNAENYCRAVDNPSPLTNVTSKYNLNSPSNIIIINIALQYSNWRRMSDFKSLASQVTLFNSFLPVGSSSSGIVATSLPWTKINWYLRLTLI